MSNCTLLCHRISVFFDSEIAGECAGMRLSSVRIKPGNEARMTRGKEDKHLEAEEGDGACPVTIPKRSQCGEIPAVPKYFRM